MADHLRGQVAVVTGSTRGVGRGIALALGEAGATVYVTGRSSGSLTTEGLPGTVESVAEEVSARGGVGIGVRCDFRDDAQIEALFARVGVCDLLVNNVWGGYENAPQGLAHGPFWTDGMEYWDRMFVCGLRAHIACSRQVAPSSRTASTPSPTNRATVSN